MAELPFWQLAAGTIVAVFVAIAVVALIRLTRLATLILVASFLALPTLALVVFAISPHQLRDPNVFLAAAPFVGLAFAALLGSYLLRVRTGRSPAFAALHRTVPLFLVAWPCLMVAVSLLVYLFEPAFALANLAINAAWFAIWAPPFTRRSDRVSSYEIAAPRDRVFAFVTDPANWPLYNPGIDSVSVQPPGPLAVGSRITLRQRLAYPGLRGPRVMMPDAVDITSEVVALEPERRLATRRLDLPDSSDEVELSSIATGTRVSGRVHNVIAYRYAVLGVRITSALSRSKQEALVAARQAKLKQLLEQP